MRLMSKVFLAFILVLSISDIAICAITTLSLIEKDGVSTNNYPLTFGHVFKDGDVSQFVQVRYNGTLLTTQCDVKTTYQSGTVRFAVISVVLPTVTANSTNNTISLETSASSASTGYMDKDAILATNIEDEIRLTNLSGSGHSGSLTADLNDKIAVDPSPAYWLQGSVATEILVRDGLNNSIESSWELRFYPGTSFGPRVSHSIENMNADYRGTVNYDIDIQAGMPSLSSKYSETSIQHNENSRWRKVLWVGSEPPETELHYDISYLISTGAVMNYDTSNIASESKISSLYNSYTSSNHDIMGNGLIVKNFPETGHRAEIAILPSWAVHYLLTMDNRMKDIVINSGEMAAHCPIHYREVNAGKSFYMHPISINDRPTIWTTENRVSIYGDTSDKLPEKIGDVDLSGWLVDRAHQGSFAYLPYIITGDRYFLDEMYYWASWSLSAMDYNASYGRDYSYGYIRDQVRGEAWGFRNLVDASAFAADGDPEKAYLANKIENNITKWMTEKDRYSLNFWDIDWDTTDVTGLDSSQVLHPVSPWMEDFMLLSLAHAREQGFSTKQILDWYSSFIINRFTHPDFNHFNGAPYRFPGRLKNSTTVSTWESANSLFLTQNTDLENGTIYPIYALGASSVVCDYAGGLSARQFLSDNQPSTSEEYRSSDPSWFLLPRNYAQSSTGKRYRLHIDQ